MDRLEAKNKGRLARKTRVRKRVSGTPARPRLTVYKSLKHIYAQIVEDSTGQTLATASTMGREWRDTLKKPAVHTPVKNGDCADCHDPHASDHGKLLAEAPSAICVTCHADVVPAKATS